MSAIDDEMFTAVVFGDSAEVSELLKRPDVNVDARDEYGNTSLNQAALFGDFPIVSAFLSAGANLHIAGKHSGDALCCAASGGHTEVMKKLLECGANPNAGENGGAGVHLSSLLNAAMNGHGESVRLLIEHGANPDAPSHGLTPLIMAAYDGHYETVELLLKAGADTNYKDVKGQTALDAAASQGHSQVVALLQDYQSGGGHRASSEGIVFDHFSAKLDALVGLNSVKADVTQLVNFLRVQKLRKDKGLSVPEQSLHMVFTGNPGTGKTTIARLIAQIYKSMGILSKGQFIETNRAGLVGGYLGQTAIKTQEVVESALGGVLFIDEAYGLTDSTHGHDMYAQEAVATLLKLMEDHRDDLIVIVAGYTEPMGKFIRSNPGLQSRFNKFLHFDDYAPAELTEIFGYFAAQGDYTLHPATELKLHNVFADLYARRNETFGNARLARNMFEKAINAHANRMVSAGMTDEASLVTLYPEDIPNA